MPSFTIFRPSNTVGTLYGLGAVAIALALGAGALYRGLTMDVKLWQLAPLLLGGGLIALALLGAYWTWGCRSLRYVVDRNALSIRWGNLQQVVPLSNIERLIPAEGGESPQIDGVDWPGHHVGRGYVPAVGEVLFYSTHRSLADVLYVQTPAETYGISVPDQVFFAQTIQSNQARGALFDQRQAVHRWGIAAQSFWLDPSARLLTLILVASFAIVLGYVQHIYPGLNETVSLRFPSLGGVVRTSDKSELLDIPRSAFGFLAVDFVLAVLLHTWERMVGYVLLLAGIAIQIMLLVAAVVAVA
ncbi:MAG TPA: PH domain-containing protein [Dehalococcoidia bacterium]|nr:PH domain-containing protein [Dehalococcoidia bacterium]